MVLTTHEAWAPWKPATGASMCVSSLRLACLAVLAAATAVNTASAEGRPAFDIAAAMAMRNSVAAAVQLEGPTRTARLAGAGRVDVDQPAKHDCDRDAAAPADRERVGEGIATGKFDARRAIRSCEAALKAYPGTARFEYQLGRAYEESRRFQEAARLYTAAVLKDYVAATTALGILHAEGQGVPRNTAEGLRLLEQAGARGSAPALHNLGSMYADGRARGVVRDPVKASEMYVDALAAGGTSTLKQFRTNAASYPADVRRLIVEKLIAGGHYKGPISSTFSPDVVRAMERLVASASQR
jgi:TPR repeat protein